MAYNPKPSALISTDIAMGWQSCMDMTCTFEPIAASAKMMRSWNATMMNLSPSEFQLYRVTLSCEGDLVAPSIFHMWPGKKFTLVPAEEFDVPTGTALTRPAHPGSVHSLDQYFNAGNGRTFWRPVLDLMVTEPWRVTAKENEKSVSWQLVAEEWQAV